ncbi:DUF862-domain-containing protein [Rickenella mellea]|uniref:DUF862-domain-containing protein n=1 Tax=Rickenella mellea TaxID=50990 RepID=A0A4Y7Q6I9_9AGAM|nr:DUF862-domain-containing protein [Rickenella mellea]
MASPVKLYVYDLSNGIARQMSLQLTGRQIDGIWHTSVVVFGKEIFYGQGISITNPGRSHHGRPLQIIDMGETALDEQTFTEYLHEIRQHYTADKYHLLDFNCNSFTNDCVGFLTGGSIPAWIKDLPTDFLSTPFGAALRPTIDAMYRRPTPGQIPAPSPRDPQSASSLLQSVANRAAGSSSTNGYLPTPAATPLQATASVASPLQLCTNPHTLNSLFRTHRAVTVFFTSQTCPPCKMVEPVFERLAEDKASEGVAFAKVDMGVGLGGEVARAWNVRVTPTFLFFLDGNKVHELKGVDAPELRTQVDLLIYQAFPPHPHTSLNLSSIRSISLDPILFPQVPAFQTAQSKLDGFIDASSSMDAKQKAKCKQTLASPVIPFLQSRFATKINPNIPQSRVHAVCSEWNKVTATLVDALPTAELFPIVDMWRLAILDEAVANWCATGSASGSSPIHMLLDKAVSAIASSDTTAVPRNFLLTTLRMLANGFSHVTLARTLIDGRSAATPNKTASTRQNLTSVLVATLLHTDAPVRTAAASVAFNVAAHCQKPLIDAQRNGRRGVSVKIDDAEGDWEVEMVSAVVEAIGRETQSEDVVHRLTASLAFILHLSPYYEVQLKPLLDVLQARVILLAKWKGGNGGLGEQGLSKKDVRRLVEEVARNLCP